MTTDRSSFLTGIELSIWFLLSTFGPRVARGQDYFPIGVWNTEFGVHIFFSNGAWHIQDDEKQLWAGLRTGALREETLALIQHRDQHRDGAAKAPMPAAIDRVVAFSDLRTFLRNANR